MTLFDLLFIALFLAAVSTLLAAAFFALRRDFSRARRLLFALLAGAGVYMAIVIASSAVLPRRTITLGVPQCFDDWCVAAQGFQRAPQASGITYTVDFRLSSRARRVSQREKYLAVYLTDSRGRRFDPRPDPRATPFDVRLDPGESVPASRSFLVPAGATGVSLVITHEGGFPIQWFIIDYDSWFRKPPLARL